MVDASCPQGSVKADKGQDTSPGLAEPGPILAVIYFCLLLNMTRIHADDAKPAQCDRIVPGWRAMPLAEWVPIAHKPQVKHLETAVPDRAVAL